MLDSTEDVMYIQEDCAALPTIKQISRKAHLTYKWYKHVISGLLICADIESMCVCTEYGLNNVQWDELPYPNTWNVEVVEKALKHNTHLEGDLWVTDIVTIKTDKGKEQVQMFYNEDTSKWEIYCII